MQGKIRNFTFICVFLISISAQADIIYKAIVTRNQPQGFQPNTVTVEIIQMDTKPNMASVSLGTAHLITTSQVKSFVVLKANAPGSEVFYVLTEDEKLFRLRRGSSSTPVGAYYASVQSISKVAEDAFLELRRGNEINLVDTAGIATNIMSRNWNLPNVVAQGNPLLQIHALAPGRFALISKDSFMIFE